MSDIEIGFGKSGRRAYGFDEIAIIPSRRTRDPEDVDVTWQIDAYRFDLPLMAAAMDGVVSPATAIAVGRLGGVGVLNLEGIWTRYVDADAVLDEMAAGGIEADAFSFNVAVNALAEGGGCLSPSKRSAHPSSASVILVSSGWRFPGADTTIATRSRC